MVSGVILAAGPSRRFPGRVKQLLEIEREPLVRRVTREALQSGLHEILVVVGCEAARVQTALSGLPVRVVENPDYECGQSSSVQAGLEAIHARASGALFIPSDQPFLTAPIIDALLAAYRKSPAARIVLPCYRGRRGAPVLWDRSLFGALNRIAGDQGGRQLLHRHRAAILQVELKEERPLLDIDCPEDLDRLGLESA